MSIRIKEIKAHCHNLNNIRDIIRKLDHRFVGLDHQTDHYYHVPEGRLKLRNGSIEKNLIYYQRRNRKGPKLSRVKLCKIHDPDRLNALLSNALGVKAVVDKEREIYFVGNVKIHLDTVKNLGAFIEIEAIDENELFTDEELQRQCEHLMIMFKINKNDLVSGSYSDMLLKMGTTS